MDAQNYKKLYKEKMLTERDTIKNWNQSLGRLSQVFVKVYWKTKIYYNIGNKSKKVYLELDP